MEPTCNECRDLIVSASFVRQVRCLHCLRYVPVCYECLPKGHVELIMCRDCAGEEDDDE